MNETGKNLNRGARRMDFGAGRGQMSPEMRAAQEKLAKMQKNRPGTPARSTSVSRVTRTTTGQTASGATIRRTATSVRYTTTGQAPTRPARTGAVPVRAATPAARTGAPARAVSTAPARVTNPARPKIKVAPRVASEAPRRTGVSAPQRPLSGATEPRERAKGMETISFDALDALGAADATEELAQSFVEEPKPLDMPKPAEKHNRAEKPVKTPQRGKNAGVSAEKTSPEADTAMNNEKAVLGGKSPFINTLNIEKRPLSGHSVKKAKPSTKKPNPQPYVTPNDNVPTVVNTKRKSRKSNIALGIAIFLTVVLGAVVGTFVYLAFFQ